MYILTHEGETLGSSKLERGDPTTHTVSGEFNNMGGSKALAGWIKSIDGEEDDGVFFIELNNNFKLLDNEGNTVDFQSGNLISVPEEDEAYLDITGLSDEVYKTYFSEHISAMKNES